MKNRTDARPVIPSDEELCIGRQKKEGILALRSE